MSSGQDFMDLPAELRIACLEFCFEKWSIWIRQVRDDSDLFPQYELVLTDRHQSLSYMSVCKQMKEDAETAILRKFDGKAVVGGWSCMKDFARMMERYNLAWVAMNIEKFEVYVPRDLTDFSCLSQMGKLETLNLYNGPDSVSRPRKSVLAILEDNAHDEEILQLAAKMQKNMIDSDTIISHVIRQQKVKVTSVWTPSAYHGSTDTGRGDDTVTFEVNLSPGAIGIKKKYGQLDNTKQVTMQDENGDFWIGKHYLRVIWPDTKASKDGETLIGNVEPAVTFE